MNKLLLKKIKKSWMKRSLKKRKIVIRLVKTLSNIKIKNEDPDNFSIEVIV